MNTYNILQPVYKVAGIVRPLEPAKPFEVFSVSWKIVGTIKAFTTSRALAYAKKAGHVAPVVELHVEQPASNATTPSREGALV